MYERNGNKVRLNLFAKIKAKIEIMHVNAFSSTIFWRKLSAPSVLLKSE